MPEVAQKRGRGRPRSPAQEVIGPRTRPLGEEIGERLRGERERQGLSQRALAARAGTSQATVRHVEGGGDAHASMIDALARALGRTAGWLIGG